jgi:hypothetical protein
MPAYANGQRYIYKGGPERKTYSDPDASWGHRSAVSTRAAGSFYGYKLHQAVCAETGLPLAWRVETAKANEASFAVPLLDALTARGFRPEVAVLDMHDHVDLLGAGVDVRPLLPTGATSTQVTTRLREPRSPASMRIQERSAPRSCTGASSR